jgi:RimJ/RimL family protein N-acetyltransferase
MIVRNGSWRRRARASIPGGVADLLHTDRLVIRDWAEDDAVAALAVYGHPEVIRWLTPAVQHVDDGEQMLQLLRRWIAESRDGEDGLGHWAITLADSGALIGGVSLHPLPVGEQDVEIGWQLAPEYWSHGYGAEAGRGIIERAFALDIDEVFALTRPANRRAEAAARRLGMIWVGETDKYYDLRLNVYRLRAADLVPLSPD